MLVEARRLGFLGPGPVEDHVAHAGGFSTVIRADLNLGVAGAADLDPLVGTDRGAGPPGSFRAADLGSGGGVPALAVALDFPDSTWVLIEAGHRRAEFLRRALVLLQLGTRVVVAEGRAEELARRPEHRGRFHLVVARGFAPPGVTAECAAPLLRRGAAAVVSEPPGGQASRWPADGLGLLGMAPRPVSRLPAGSFQVIDQVGPCPDRYPRRLPAKRPLF